MSRPTKSVGLTPVPRARHPQSQRPAGVGPQQEVGGVARCAAAATPCVSAAAPRATLSRQRCGRGRADPGAQRAGRPGAPRADTTVPAGRAGGAGGPRWRARRDRRGDRSSPVAGRHASYRAPAARRGPTTSYQSVCSHVPDGGQQPVEEPGRGRVGDVARQVLAADQVDVVDPQVDRRHLVTRRPTAPGPLDQAGPPSPQGVRGLEEGPTVGEGGGELGVERPRAVQGVELRPRGVGDVELRGAPRQRGGAGLLGRACRGRWRAR